MKPFLPDVFKPHVDFYPPAAYLTSIEVGNSQFQQAAEDYVKLGITSNRLDLSGLVYKNTRASSGAAR